jgi:rRNA biogenesis protein RRP5
VKAFVPPGHFNDDSVVGQRVIGVVLDRDCQQSVIDVSLKQHLVTLFSQTAKLKKQPSTSDTSHQVLSRGSLVDVCVELIKPDYMILSLLDSSPTLAVAPTKAHVNDVASLLPASKRYAVGDTMKATVEIVPDRISQTIASLPAVSFLPVVVSVPQELADMKIGTTVTAKITSIKDFQLNVNIKEGCQGRIHITEMQDNIQPGDKPFDGYHPGQELQAVILGFRDSKSHKYLPISHQNFKRTIVELSLRQRLGLFCCLTSLCIQVIDSWHSLSDAKSRDLSEVLSPKRYLKQLKEGDSVTGFVQEVDKHALTVVLTPAVRGSVAAVHLSKDIVVVKKVRKHFSPGQCLTLTVLETHISKAFAELSLIGSLEELRQLSEVGGVGVGRVVKQVASQGLHVQLPGRKLGLVALTDVSDDYRKVSLSDFHENSFVKYAVLEISSNGHIDLSLRPSCVLSAESVNKSEIPEVTDRQIKSLKDISEGDVVRGFVVSVAQRAGVFIRLGRKLTARAKIAMLFDGYFKNWDKHFQIGQVVRTKVLSVDKESGQVDVSLRLSDVDPAAAAKHRKERSLKRKRRNSESERSNSKKKPKISSGEDSGNETGHEMDVIFEMKKSNAWSSSEEESENEGDWSSEETEVVEVGRFPTDNLDKPKLKLSRKFDWNEQSTVAMAPESQVTESSDEEQEEANEPSRKKTKRQKRAKKKEDEAKIYQVQCL